MKIRQPEHTVACKVCQQTATLFGMRDFNTTCNSEYLLSDISIYYHQCSKCGLIFTVAFDDWGSEEYGRYIYNAEYIQYDPEFESIRPKANLETLKQNFPALKQWLVLDYGGGGGKLAALLKAEGVQAVGWDPFYGEGHRPGGCFDFICSFEVFEHTPAPIETLLDLQLFLHPQGVIFFSTLVHDGRTQLGINNPYIAPRNGHITIHTRESLKRLFARVGMSVIHYNDAFHIAWFPTNNSESSL
ncbi:class I SAM-dependent methyltransferase [Citrobacter portucalensis]|uniref:class I SAM-dependent methyltransferase n=1 Tax=Citrobacter portucalensis TaxID=1639133 RepID=UPI003CF7D331